MDPLLSPHRELFPTDWTTKDKRPMTQLQALMEQSPGGNLDESVEEATPIIDAIRCAADHLTTEQTFILNAINSEGLTFEELGARLGVSKSYAWRLHARAMLRLRTLVLYFSIVRERLDMEPTWQSEALRELVVIAGSIHDHPLKDAILIDSAVFAVNHHVTDAARALESGLELRVMESLTQAGRYSVDYLRSVDEWSLLGMHELLVSKQHDYGHGNILRFGMTGLVVRCSDKVERLKNLTAQSTKPRNEPLLDGFRDIIGYATIARMLKAETFELDLADDDDPLFTQEAA